MDTRTSISSLTGAHELSGIAAKVSKGFLRGQIKITHQ